MYIKTIAELEEQLNSISEQIKELKNKPKFEVNRWYKIDGEPFMKYLVEHLSENDNKGYGLNRYGEWSDNDFGLSSCKPATPEEVKAALVKEAEKRGYRKDVDVKSLMYAKGKIDSNIFSFDITKHNTRLYIGKNGQFNIFDNGKWAEIIKDYVIKVGSYEVKFHNEKEVLFCEEIGTYPGKRTTIDGNLFTKEFWQSAKLISEHSKAKIMVGCSKQFDVSLETINAILAKL